MQIIDYNNDIAPLVMFVASFYPNHKYQKIDKAIQFHFCNKFSKYFNS